MRVILVLPRSRPFTWLKVTVTKYFFNSKIVSSFGEGLDMIRNLGIQNLNPKLTYFNT